jgi:NAD-dependent deacetylase
MSEEELINAAVEIIRNSHKIVVFTGAGSSTESGIADFRSEGGLWSRYDPSIYANYNYFVRDPSKFWKMHNELIDIFQTSKPNPIHTSVAILEKLGKVEAIITQNIDALHQAAGSGEMIPIYELHGSYKKLECIKCKKQFKFEEVDTKNVNFPVCECGGLIKPNVVLFGEALPTGVLDAAIRASSNCDCFIMIGSSLLVSPANLMPQIAKQCGAKIIFINRDNTAMDELADIFIKGSGGEILDQIMRRL